MFLHREDTFSIYELTEWKVTTFNTINKKKEGIYILVGWDLSNLQDNAHCDLNLN